VAAEVVYLATAEADLASIYDWLSEVSEPSHAFAYIDRIQTACEALADFPGRGAPRDDLDPGLRSIVFRRRATIYYRAGPAAVEIVRVLYAGRDAGRAFSRS
jgi:toxin ParE1/3/4